MDIWYPLATKVLLSDAGAFVGGPYRIVIHSTEGATASGAIAAYRKGRVSPHFTASFEGGRFQVWQHVALNRSSTALEHRSGTCETNRQSAIQIEVVAYAAKPDWAPELVEGVAALLAWIAVQTGVQAHAPEFLPYPASYGANPVRMDCATWLAFNGVCGHEHVPNQSHGDPGAIPITALLAGIAAPAPEPKETKPMYDPPLGPIAAAWLDDQGRVISAVSPIGQVFWGKWYGNVAGKPYWGDRVAALIGPRPDGNPGYRITDTAGESYDLPDGLDQL